MFNTQSATVDEHLQALLLLYRQLPEDQRGLLVEVARAFGETD